jgi:poly(A) polymerase
LLDAGLQSDRNWRRRLRWAQRLGLPLMPALLAGACDPLNLAERLQVPHRQHRLLVQLNRLQTRLKAAPVPPQPPSWWCELLEAPGLSADSVALAIALAVPQWRFLLRWWLHWRHVRSPTSAAALMQREGIKPGPELGRRLHQLRLQVLDQLP